MSLLTQVMRFSATDKIAQGLGQGVQKSTLDKVALGISVIIGAGIFGLMALKYGRDLVCGDLTERDTLIRVRKDHNALRQGECRRTVVLAAVEALGNSTTDSDKLAEGAKLIRSRMSKDLKKEDDVIVALMCYLPDEELKNTVSPDVWGQTGGSCNQTLSEKASGLAKRLLGMRASLYSQFPEGVQKDSLVAECAVRQGFGSAYRNLAERDKLVCYFQEKQTREKVKTLALRAMETDYTVVSEVVKYCPYLGTGLVRPADIDFWPEAIRRAGKSATQDAEALAVDRPGRVVAETVFTGNLRTLLEGPEKVAKAYREMMARPVASKENHAV